MKRKLKDSYSVFLADSRLIPSLSKPLGQAFYKSKKFSFFILLSLNNTFCRIPLSVHLENEKNAAKHIQKVLNSTYFYQPRSQSRFSLCI
jgi:hypothetical protein